MRETGLVAAERNLLLLEAVVRDEGRSSIAALARQTQISVAAAHRHIEALVNAGYLVQVGYARHLPGPKLRALAGMIDNRQLLANSAEPILRALATRIGCVVQLGIFENDMVTYLVKAGQSAGDLFTQVGMQLEAYCSGIGKVLLANLPAQAQAAYLAGGPFIALTENTITGSDQLAAVLSQVAGQGYAVDDEEVALGLKCLAVPVRNKQGEVVAAISLSDAADSTKWQAFDRLLSQLEVASGQIGSMEIL